MRWRRRVSVAVLALGLVLFAGCNDDPLNPARGFISVLVVDGSGPPVPDVEIRVVPPGLTAKTDAHGTAMFTLPPGDYFVDASLCCRGPGFIEYHVPVTVTAGETASVELEACLTCE